MVSSLGQLLLIASAWGWGDFTPEQIHLSWAEEDSSMYVTWAAQNSTWLPTFAQYRPAGSNDTAIAAGTWRDFYNKQDNNSTRHLYVCVAKMVNLTAGSFYEYQVGSILGMSDWFTFEAKRDFTGQTTRFLIYGDFGTGSQIKTTMKRLEKEIKGYKYDAIVHIGDMAYDLNDDDGRNGDLFLNSIQPLAAKIPYMTSQGNHEGPGHSCTQHYQMRFQMPGNSTNFWYSYDTGITHFVVFSTEFVIYNQTDLQSAQMAWLEQDLAKVNRTAQPWLVTLAHRPMYCSPDWYLQLPYDHAVPWERHNKDCLQSGPAVQAAFEDLFYQYGVDLQIYGHVHAYERMAPVYKNESVSSDYETYNYYYNPHAPIHIITGIPGQQESYAPVSPTPLEFSVAQSAELGYGRLTVFNETTLLFEQVGSVNGTVLDYVTIVKSNTTQAFA
mmetsp:Transcript_900/g.2137  ORF Transcript_900/g.2137 Transcript_900/m.2137 type:complete len:440 (-) Transcript_900:327-1646(-)|eukprot:CAMPEP_0204917510 /NCGR_PEP_ID=MMETSP1397-20131031/15120_1 /ASSEMBLY_ACC=CAM_ASM_000891 /TAXON_ID=49980 /ORGANISM="Climacostomum Climacostomum virens, Strain Stock W-24" /LENGTH=439 /DNA_ID=CAMNT_0052090373 /DNA_START=238 /DNA_END=1557 /DNA_ORIENTATION=-